MREKFRFFDAHGHPQFSAYDGDRDAIMGRAIGAGVGMIAVGTHAASSEDAIKLAEKYPDRVWAAIGFHPSHLLSDWHHDKNEQENSEREKFDISKLRKMAVNPRVVAIGECGLDYFRKHSAGDEKNQKDGFLAQIELAHEVKKPLMIHCRAAFPDLIEILNSKSQILNNFPGIIHFFSGTLQDAKELLEMGFYFTFGGVITFARDYDEVVNFLPIDRILSETDAPYVSPAPYRGQRNEPAYVAEVVKKLAEIKGIGFEPLRLQLLANALSVFGINLST